MARLTALLAAVLSLAAAGCGGREATAPQPPATPDPVAGFVGAKACAACHEAAAHAWAESTHGRHALSLGTPKDGATFGVGSKWMQAYLKADGSGLHRIAPECLDLRDHSWRNVAEVLREIAGPVDGPPDRLLAIDDRSFETDCAGCHASQATLSTDVDRGRLVSRHVDLSINCETCHGPGRAHAEAWRRLDASAPLARLERLSPRASVAVCARCHGGPPTAGEFGPADAPQFVAWLRDRPSLFPDGSAAGQVYQAVGFVRSPCHLRGGLTCVDCHDAHGPGLREGGDVGAVCVRCHAAEASREHTGHPQNGPGGRCIDCHMPRLLKGLTAHQRDHRIGVPLPATARAPDACTACHADRTRAWVDAAWRKRYGDPPAATLAAVEAIATAREGRKDLLALTRALTHPDPYFRANAAIFLLDPRAVIADPVPEVRLMAIYACPETPEGVELLDRLLLDAEPRIRAAAATERMRRGAAPDPRWRTDLTLAARHLRDEADVRRALALLAQKRGDAREAARWMMAAFEARPLDAEAAIEVAAALRSIGHERPAEAVLHAAMAATLDQDARRRIAQDLAAREAPRDADR